MAEAKDVVPGILRELHNHFIFRCIIQVVCSLLMDKESISIFDGDGIWEIRGLQVPQGVEVLWLLIPSVRSNIPQVVAKNSVLIRLLWSTLKVLAVGLEGGTDIAGAIRGIALIAELIELR